MSATVHTVISTTPFEVVYGPPPPAILPYTAGSARMDTVDALLSERDSFLADVCDRLLQAQEKHYNAHHRSLEFAVNDWVWLRILHRPAQSLVPVLCGKLGPRFAGPFQVLERIGPVAYRLCLPDGARIHDVFHVGVLKPYKGPLPATTPTLPPLHKGCLLHWPARALRAQLRHGVWHVLIQ